MSTRAALAAFLLACSGPTGGAGPPLDENELAYLDLITSARIEAFGSEASLRAWVNRLPRPYGDEVTEVEPSANIGAVGVLRAMTGSWNGPVSPYGSQTAGILEGDIVGVHGRHLVVLRRGRLFSVRLGDVALTPIAMVDVPPPGTRSGWYDEMLVSGDTIVVLGYSYEREGTELHLFHIDRDGRIEVRHRFYLRSNDYYSSESYATRLIGSRLFMYVPIDLSAPRGDVPYTLPGWRDDPAAPWRDLISAEQVLRPVQATTEPYLHTVISCELGGARPACTARSIVGPHAHEHYVSSSAFYVWVGEDDDVARSRRPTGEPANAVYRMPLDGGPITALRTEGMPNDQFSFLEVGAALLVLVRPDPSSGSVALLRAPLRAFTADVLAAERGWYTRLPAAEGALENRFVGRHLLYGSRSAGRVFVHALGGDTTALRLTHTPDRIEAAGARAMIIGAGAGELVFSSIDLAGTPSIDARGAIPGARETETRSHAFYFRADGVIGLPVSVRGSESVTFFRLADRRLTRLGELSAQRVELDDRCTVSCTDWYGSGRPLFVDQRVFALLGYDLVEGAIAGASVSELRRTNLYTDR